ncbi:MAG TPA: beta galactosidase jelly roll domain-containing protein, partial [Pyrinomonadaceae bacterium]|nr:beta galactosidase jelly roll domain-containing protein [Pyrinomonadaceae bacterium]
MTAFGRQLAAQLLTVCLLALSADLSGVNLSAARGFEPPQSPRAKFNFNPGWKLLVGDPAGAEGAMFDDSAWRQISLPHAWNEDAAFRVGIHDLPTGIAWYRKHFTLPAGSEGRKVFLEFEGIRHAGEFYLNGEFIGRHENGVMAFGFDVTDRVKWAPAENVIAARIDNSWDYRERATGSTFQWNDRNFYANYGGINKNVWLHVTDKVYQTLPLFSSLGTEGTYVYAEDFDIPGHRAMVTAATQIRNEYPSARTVD